MNNSVRNLLIKKLLYRSKQRGWLEVDLILGSWASKNLKNLSNNDLLKYQNFVNEDTVDIYNYLTKTKKVESNLDEKLINRIINDTKKEINTPKKYSLVKEVMSN
jgi:succinate dehydrogenase assembly factor 2